MIYTPNGTLKKYVYLENSNKYYTNSLNEYLNKFPNDQKRRIDIILSYDYNRYNERVTPDQSLLHYKYYQILNEKKNKGNDGDDKVVTKKKVKKRFNFFSLKKEKEEKKLSENEGEKYFEIEKLCDDVICEILSFFGQKELVKRFSILNRKFYSFCRSSRFWKKFMINNDELARVHINMLDLTIDYLKYPISYFLKLYPTIEILDLTYADTKGVIKLFKKQWKQVKTVVLNKYEQGVVEEKIKETNPQITVKWLEDIYKEEKTDYLVVRFLGSGRKIPISIPNFDILVKDFIELLCNKIGYDPAFMKRLFFKELHLESEKKLSFYKLKSGDECFYYFRHIRG